MSSDESIRRERKRTVYLEKSSSIFDISIIRGVMGICLLRGAEEWRILRVCHVPAYL